MKTIEINLYKFEELSEDAQQKAIENNYSINVDFDWWGFVYDDAKNIGCTINGFDIDRGNYCDLRFTNSAAEIAQDILNNHGEKCDTYRAAESFLNEFNPLFADYMNEDSEKYESAETEDDLIYLEDEFKSELSECYLSMLRNEYEYKTSEEAIKETIEANEYDFTEDGNMY